MFSLTKAKYILNSVTSSLIITSSIMTAVVKEESVETEPTEVQAVYDTLEYKETSTLLEPIQSVYGIVHLEITADTAATHSQHYLHSDIENVYKKGTIVTANTTLSNGWYQLISGEYISSELIKVREDLGNKLFIQIIADELNVRDKPDRYGKATQTLKKGYYYQAVDLYENGWYKLSDGKYLSGEFVKPLLITKNEYEALREKHMLEIQKAQKLRDEKIAKQKKAELEKKKQLASVEVTKAKGTYASIKISTAERDLLARLIYCEANAEPFKGQVAVAQVILNRVLDSRFPDTVSGVIGAKNQFVPYSTGKINRVTPTEENYRAIDEALTSGNLSGAVYFHNPKYANGSWWRSLKTVTNIGNHSFKK